MPKATAERFAIAPGIKDLSGGVHETQSQLVALQTALQSTHSQTQIVNLVEWLGDARAAGSFASGKVTSADLSFCTREQPLPDLIHPQDEQLGPQVQQASPEVGTPTSSLAESPLIAYSRRVKKRLSTPLLSLPELQRSRQRGFPKTSLLGAAHAWPRLVVKATGRKTAFSFLWQPN